MNPCLNEYDSLTQNDETGDMEINRLKSFLSLILYLVGMHKCLE